MAGRSRVGASRARVALGRGGSRSRMSLAGVKSSASPKASAAAAKPRIVADTTLPDGWVAAKDPESDKTYYVNRKTRETTWTRPTEQVSRFFLELSLECRRDSNKQFADVAKLRLHANSTQALGVS
eukprot:TRINITY_DN80853_c0_g1_i1.p2 TRINITY_DN80853_c0_g1~~TRINITY_DN80853_c0_g1_i1.p2  ORF type:complete len:133 (+),score=14.50 TRINITY_DN80853_c0_g1_i1:22-399(+)